MALARSLKENSTAAVGRPVAATGWGGIGKTELATEFVHRYGRFFRGGVFWLSAEDEDTLRSQVAECGAQWCLDLWRHGEPQSQQENINAVWEAWQEPVPRLIVLDNCENADVLHRWRPSNGEARVLVTSRRNTWPPGVEVTQHTLGTLARAQSIALLRRGRPDLSANDANLDAIADALGDLPIALRLTADYLEDCHPLKAGQPEQYLADLRAYSVLDHPALQGEQTPETVQEKGVAQSFWLSLSRLDTDRDTDALAREMLTRAACFAPGESIPGGVLRATAPNDAGEKTVHDALNRLAALGLLERQAEDAWQMHRLVARFAWRTATEGETAQAAGEDALKRKAYEINQGGLPAPFVPLQPHVDHAAVEAEKRGAPANAGWLFTELGYHAHMVAAHGAARAHYQRALDNAQQAYGPEHSHVAACLNNLGSVAQDEGDLPAARDYFERALAIDENTHGPDHPMVATRLNNLGSLAYYEGGLLAARRYLERALAIDENTHGPDDPHVARDRNNLGCVAWAEGDLPAARQYFERALRVWAEKLSPDHPDTNTARDNLRAAGGTPDV